MADLMPGHHHGPRFAIQLADADQTVQAVADGTDPHVTGQASGSSPTYDAALAAALRVLDQMHQVDHVHRVQVTVHGDDGQPGASTPWTSPSEAARQLRTPTHPGADHMTTTPTPTTAP